MPNFFTENPDLKFHFERFDLRETVGLIEHEYSYARQYAHAPVNYDDAMENYWRVLEVVGELAGGYISDRTADVDRDGAQLEHGQVQYASGTQEALAQLSKADLMGLVVPHQYGGLNFPFTIYCMAVEIISRADASLMNIFGLQDIADNINKFGDVDQRQRYLPGFATGEYTGAMALTEPDAGSDLQSIKTQAYQDGTGQWYLRGVKRFITNGCGDILLVMARSEPGTKDARGISMYVCRKGDHVKVRRIENKLGIHGSPTCELQFNDAPAELVGKRKLGLIKYVFDLMFRARMGVSAQGLGISQQAYELALKYAKERVQFGKTIYNIPAVTNLLIDMRVMLEANRTLFYHTAHLVDLKERLEERVEALKRDGRSHVEESLRVKRLLRTANLLTPLCKLLCTEGANKITYDALQVHGGTGYMKEFAIERLARDARITNIYEGTSQLQVVAALGGVVTDALGEWFEEKERKDYKGGLGTLSGYLQETRRIYRECLQYVTERRDTSFQEVAGKDLVELYSYALIGYLLLDQAETDPRKVFVANRYILNAASNARKNAEAIKSGVFADILHADEILV
ncbi:acyl-CoA dehydrogenase family protein [Myxococcota bacterium]